MKYNKNITLAIVIAVVGFLILIWYIVILIPNHLNLFYELSLTKASQVGDFVGGFIGVVFTIAGFILLYETLNLQRIESTNTRNFLKIQQFENNFFQLMKSYNHIVSTMDVNQELFDDEGEMASRDVFYSGKDCFGFWFSGIKDKMNEQEFSKEEFISYFHSFYIKWELDLSIYYSQIYQILKFVEYSKIDNEMIYIDLFKANLSIHELAFLFYYTFIIADEEHRRLVDKYNFFGKLQTRNLINPVHINFMKKRNE